MTEDSPPIHADLSDTGLITHQLLDNLYLQFMGGDLRLQVNTPNVSFPPTDAELDAEFGTPTAVGAGFIRLLHDAGGGVNFYIVASDGANWWTISGTKAV